MTTMPEPINKARTRFRPGSRTSLPRNVTLVQAVCAKSGPTIDFPKIRANASAPAILKPGWATRGLQPFAQESHHAAVWTALVARQPRDNPTTTTAMSPVVLTKVKTFCTSVPSLSPRVFVQVKSATNAIATSCCVDKLIAYPPPNETG